MQPLIWITIFAGALASVACARAMVEARAFKQSQGQNGWVLQTYWGVIMGYTMSFTALRLAHAMGLPLEVPIFYIQTLFGAGTIVSLLYIFFAILLGKQAARVSAEIGIMAAFATVFLIFFYGVQGPMSDNWGVELIPSNVVARIAVAMLYVVMPMALGILITRAVRTESPAVRLQYTHFGLSVFLVFAPNAIRYVAITSGPFGAILALTMAAGAVIGCRSYRGTCSFKADTPVENG